MSKPTIKIVDVTTGEEIEREMTAEEIAALTTVEEAPSEA